MHLKRIFWIIIGLISLGIGYIGMFVPGLPTTVFVIISLWCFTKASPRLSKWARSIPLFSQAVAHADEYQKTKNISKKVKIIAQTFAWSSVLLFFVTAGLGLSLLLVVIAALSCSVFMWKTKTKRISATKNN